jgi:hypothetical protein
MPHGPGIELRPADPTRWERAKLPRAQHDSRSAERFRADLEAEAERSLARDPSRWPWLVSTEIADRHRSNRGRRW